MKSYQRTSSLIPEHVPVIIESMIREADIQVKSKRSEPASADWFHQSLGHSVLVFDMSCGILCDRDFRQRPSTRVTNEKGHHSEIKRIASASAVSHCP